MYYGIHAEIQIYYTEGGQYRITWYRKETFRNCTAFKRYREYFRTARDAKNHVDALLAGGLGYVLERAGMYKLLEDHANYGI